VSYERRIVCWLPFSTRIARPVFFCFLQLINLDHSTLLTIEVWIAQSPQ